ncbi:hypothetical protein [Microlunatus endophyticus]
MGPFRLAELGVAVLGAGLLGVGLLGAGLLGAGLLGVGLGEGLGLGRPNRSATPVADHPGRQRPGWARRPRRR